jgi:hypothetical protein
VKKMFVKKVAGGVQPGAAAPKGAPAKVRECFVGVSRRF